MYNINKKGWKYKMEFFDKLTKKASETYKGAAEKTGKIAKEAKLKIKINELKSKINDIYEEIGKKVYQKHVSSEDLCIKNELEEECVKIDELSAEIEGYHKEILELSNIKACVSCGEHMAKEAKFCPKCGTEQPEIKEEPAKEVEVLDEDKVEESVEENASEENTTTENIQEENQENNENVENTENSEE